MNKPVMPPSSLSLKLPKADRRIEILNERGELKPAPASLATDPPSRG